MTLRVIAGESERGMEMVPCQFGSFAAKFELSKRGPVERIRCEAIGIGDGPDLLDRPIEGNDWRWANRDERVVKRHNFRPVRVLDPECGGVHRCDCRFNMILAG